jgi:hypothetical protein
MGNEQADLQRPVNGGNKLGPRSSPLRDIKCGRRRAASGAERGLTFTIDSAWLWDYRIKRRPVSLALPNVDSTVEIDRGRYSRRLHRFSNRYGRGTLFHKEQSKTLVPEQSNNGSTSSPHAELRLNSLLAPQIYLVFPLPSLQYLLPQPCRKNKSTIR